MRTVGTLGRRRWLIRRRNHFIVSFAYFQGELAHIRAPAICVRNAAAATLHTTYAEQIAIAPTALLFFIKW